MFRSLMAMVCVLGLLAAVTPALAQGDALEQVPQSRQMLKMSFAPLVKKTGPAVVNIYAKRIVKEQMQVISPFFNDPFFKQFFNAPGFGGPVRERVESALGSGVIVDPSGLIATNTHVIKGASEVIAVTSDGREFAAKMVLVDEKTDLAVLRINPGAEKLPYLDMADSDDLAVGDIVLAIGNPFGVGQTVTSGIVSALARTGVGATDYSFFIQTDAAINPGNSGGALVDVHGNLLGINTAIYSRSGGSLGIGFAIPVSTAKMVLDGIVRDGQVTRGWIGVEPSELSPELAETFGIKATEGVIITGVLQDGPAGMGGIRPGDVIAQVADKPIGSVPSLLSAVAALRPGEKATFQVQRGDKMLELELTPGVRPRQQRTQQR